MTERRIAALLVVVGASLVAVGLALIYMPAGIIAAGGCLAVVGIDARVRT